MARAMSYARNRNAATSAHPLCRESITLRNCFSTSVRSWWAFRWIRAERSLFAKEKAASKCALCAQHESTTAMQEATSSITNERSKSRFLGIARFCTDREILALHERKTFALQWRFLWHHFHGNAPAGNKSTINATQWTCNRWQWARQSHGKVSHNCRANHRKAFH